MRAAWLIGFFALCACGSNSHSDAGAGGEAGATFGGGGGSGGSEPIFGAHCPTKDDGAELLKDGLVGVPSGYVDASHFYYTRPGNYESTINRFALVPDAPLEAVYSTSALVRQFILHDPDMWWVEGPFAPPYASTSTLQRVAKEPVGSQPEIVLDGDVGGFRANAQGLIVARQNEPGSQLDGRFELLPWSGASSLTLCDYPGGGFDVNESLVAFASYYGIATCPLSAGTATIIVSFAETIYGFAIDATYAYWRTPTALKRIPLTGGSPEIVTDLAESYDAEVTLLLEDSDILYEHDGRVLRIPKTGGVATELVPKQSHGISFVTTDATYVYWGDGGEFDITCVKRKPLARASD